MRARVGSSLVGRGVCNLLFEKAAGASSCYCDILRLAPGSWQLAAGSRGRQQMRDEDETEAGSGRHKTTEQPSQQERETRDTAMHLTHLTNKSNIYMMNPTRMRASRSSPPSGGRGGSTRASPGHRDCLS